MQTKLLKRCFIPEYESHICKIKGVTAISVGKGQTKACYLKVLKSLYHIEFLDMGGIFGISVLLV